MIHLRSSLIVRLLTAIFMLGGLLTLQLSTPSPASALGAGRVCVFYYPFGDGFVGHTGWAFSVPGSSSWIYGSSDGSDGGNSPHGFDSAPITHGDWVISADQGFNDVLSTFRTRAYTAYTCKNTGHSSVGAAQNKAFSDRSYDFLTNNCANHVDDILSAYDSVFSQHYGDDTLIPLDWFNSLQGSSGQGFEAVQPLFAPSGFKGGTVKAADLAMRKAGNAGPVTLSSPVYRRTSLGTQLVVVCWISGPSITATWADGETYSTTVWDAVNDQNAGSLTEAPRYAVSDAWLDTGGDTSKLVHHC